MAVQKRVLILNDAEITAFYGNPCFTTNDQRFFFSLNDNEELAEVLNWIVLEFSGDSLNTSFEHYTAIEVGSLRRAMLNEVVKYRPKVLADIAAVKSRE
jgi:hypothetical protein